MHFPIGVGASKLIRCSRGAILDVVVDIRRASPEIADELPFEYTAPG